MFDLRDDAPVRSDDAALTQKCEGAIRTMCVGIDDITDGFIGASGDQTFRNNGVVLVGGAQHDDHIGTPSDKIGRRYSIVEIVADQQPQMQAVPCKHG